MPYRPLKQTSLPPHVARLAWKLEHHYFRPVHSMFRLPVPNYRLQAECHFAIAEILLASISGVSTTLYSKTGGNGARFRQLLIDYYPFSQEPGNTVQPSDAARTLWSVFRNPLSHDLGFDVDKNAKTPKVKIMRSLTKTRTGNNRGLTEKKIEALEKSSHRPTMKPTLTVRTDATVLFVDALYWGTRGMVESVLADSARVHAAESFLKQL